jgi:hypothetical protein
VSQLAVARITCVDVLMGFFGFFEAFGWVVRAFVNCEGLVKASQF